MKQPSCVMDIDHTHFHALVDLNILFGFQYPRQCVRQPLFSICDFVIVLGPARSYPDNLVCMALGSIRLFHWKQTALCAKCHREPVVFYLAQNFLTGVCCRGFFFFFCAIIALAMNTIE